MPTTTIDSSLETAVDNLRSLAVPHVAEYFGWWAIYDVAFRGMVDYFKSIDVHAHIATEAAAKSEDAPNPLASDYRRLGGNPGGQQIAFVEITGPMMKFRSSMAAGTSTVQVRRQIRAAVNDPMIGAILIHFDTPGGTYAGTADLGMDIAAAAAAKPTYSFVSDCCASAGYWAASQAREVIATKTSMVGSIGTFLRLEDTSGAAAAAGVKVHVLRAGDFKGRLSDGVEIDADALAEMQNMVESLNEFFILAVADGRRLKPDVVRSKLADGRLHMADAAKTLGLIDRVSTLDAELQRINQQLIKPGKVRTMTTENPQTENPAPVAGGPAIAGELLELRTAEPAAATIADIEAACPGAAPGFVLSQLKQGATIAAATRAFIAEQQKEIATLKTATPATPAAATKDLAGAGVDPLATNPAPGPNNGQTATEQMKSWIEAKKATGVPAAKAVLMFVKQNPGLHQMVLAENSPQA